MAGALVTPTPTLPPAAAGGVEAVHPRGRRETRQDRKDRRRPGAAVARVPEEEPEPVRPPSGRLDVMA